MPATTVTSLISRAKAMSDMRDNFVVPDVWTQWATQERMGLDMTIARSGWALNLTSFDIVITGAEAGSFTVNPTGGVMTIVAVYQAKENGSVRLLTYEDAVTFLATGQGSEGSARRYRVITSGDNLVLNLVPAPTAGETYRVAYLPHPKVLVVSGATGWQESSVSYPMGWEERIVLGMARRALIKEESDTKSVDQEIGALDQRIEEACWSRVLSAAPAVRNVDANRYGWSTSLALPPAGGWVWL